MDSSNNMNVSKGEKEKPIEVKSNTTDLNTLYSVNNRPEPVENTTNIDSFNEIESLEKQTEASDRAVNRIYGSDIKLSDDLSINNNISHEIYENNFVEITPQEKIEDISTNDIDKINNESKKKNYSSNKSSNIFMYLMIVLIVVSFAGVVFYGVKSYQDKHMPSKKEANVSKMHGLRYTVPDNFLPSSINDEFYNNYSLTEPGNFCDYSIRKYSKTLYKTTEDYFNSYIKPEEKSIVSEKTIKEINKISWQEMTVTTDTDEQYYYAYDKNNSIYTVEFTIFSKDSKKCKKSLDTIMNSIEFK